MPWSRATRPRPRRATAPCWATAPLVGHGESLRLKHLRSPAVEAFTLEVGAVGRFDRDERFREGPLRFGERDRAGPGAGLHVDDLDGLGVVDLRLTGLAVI